MLTLRGRVAALERQHATPAFLDVCWVYFNQDRTAAWRPEDCPGTMMLFLAGPPPDPIVRHVHLYGLVRGLPYPRPEAPSWCGCDRPEILSAEQVEELRDLIEEDLPARFRPYAERAQTLIVIA